MDDVPARAPATAPRTVPPGRVPMRASADETVATHDLPGGGRLHRTRGGFWRVGDGTGAFARLTDADLRAMHRLSAATVLYEAPRNAEGALIRIERRGPADYRILTSAPALSPEWFQVETRPSWSSAGAFVGRYSDGYACPDLAEPNGESLAEWRARTGEHGGAA